MQRRVGFDLFEIPSVIATDMGKRKKGSIFFNDNDILTNSKNSMLGEDASVSKKYLTSSVAYLPAYLVPRLVL